MLRVSRTVKHIFSIFVLLTLNLEDVKSAKILGVFPFMSSSHYSIGSALFKELAMRGHDLTVISPFVEKNIPSNISYRAITLNQDASKKPHMDLFSTITSNPYNLVLAMNGMGAGIVHTTLQNEEVQELLTSGQKFDAVILDQFVDDALAYLAHRFGGHHILLFTGFANIWVNSLVGNPAPPSVVPELLQGCSTRMNFWERVQNTLFHIFHVLHRNFIFFPTQQKMLKQLMPNASPLEKYIYNVSLVLLNGHESLSDPMVLTPNMKNIAGMHVKPGRDLPEDVRYFMDDAKEGVVYFSMGSNLKSKDMPKPTRDSILRVFSRLNVKVLWKWEEDELPGQPPNVKIHKWLPQESVLAHRNLKVFITHGGLLSCIEAIHYGVPLLALPVYADQKTNAASASQKGYAIHIPFSNLNEKNFEESLQDLLSNPKYKDNAIHRSRLLRDRPLKPMDEAVYWVEYVIRHHGAEHLRFSAINLQWYQYLLLDVLAFYLGILIVIYVLYKKIRLFRPRTVHRNSKK